MFNVKSVDETLKIIEEHFSGYPIGDEVLGIIHTVGRVVSGDIASSEDIPSFNRSSVDGYAVLSSDTFGASEAIPAQLKLMEEVRMGEKSLFAISSGYAAYVPTGGEIPPGADSVVMIEYTEDLDDGYIYINKSSAPGSHLVLKGDDVKKGHRVLRGNQRLRPQDIGVLAALGISTVRVKRKIKVGIISTGNEIVEIDEKQYGAKVRDVNSYTLYAGIAQHGAEPVLYGIVKDSFDEIKRIVEKALSECDVILISGGSSVGTRDETYHVINSFGEPGVLVHGIAVKPGKPTIIGKVRHKAVIGLPGHPASAYMIYMIFVRYLLDVMQEVSTDAKNSISARMSVNYPSNNGREEFVPVKLVRTEQGVLAEPVFGKSGLIAVLSNADGYLRIDRGTEGLPKGEEVRVILF